MKTHSERGAILVHVALVLISLIGFSALTIDYGQFWVARRQAQNAADAGALAGALARIQDDPSSPPASNTSGVVYDNVVTTVGLNRIWGEAPPPSTVTLGWDCPSGTTDCVVVDVFRDGTNTSNPLSTFFLQMLNVTTHGVRAHAVAEIVGANATGCMRPVFLIDKYTDTNGNDLYDAGDAYVSPGWRVPEDIGTTVTFHDNLTPSGYGQIEMPNGTAGANDAWRYCATGRFRIGDTVPTKPGNSGGQKHGVRDVIEWDEDAYFDPDTGRVEDSCAETGTCGCMPNCPYGGAMSPRIIIVPICSPLQADCAAGGPDNGSVTITNFLSFFLLDEQDLAGKLEIFAVLIGTGGEVDRGGTPAPLEGTFLKAPVLIR